MASSRIRIAELASSMLWAAPLLALLTVPAAALLASIPRPSPSSLLICTA